MAKSYCLATEITSCGINDVCLSHFLSKKFHVKERIATLLIEKRRIIAHLMIGRVNQINSIPDEGYGTAG